MNIMAQPVAAPSFAALRARREAALTAERHHDNTIGFETPETAAESDRLADVRDKVETALMATPSPDAAAFAYKYLVAFGDGREADFWKEIIEAEARRFSFPQSHWATPWIAALTDYEVKRAEWDRLGEADSPDCPGACDACMAAQDYLVEHFRAPNVEAAVFKMELAKERWDGFGVPDAWIDAFAADFRHLCPTPSDPHMGWLSERDTLLTIYNLHSSGDDEADQPIYDAASAIEERILTTPAVTRDGILAKALLIVGAACGANTDSEQAVFDEAKALGLIEWDA